MTLLHTDPAKDTVARLANLTAERAQVRQDGDRHYRALCATRERLADLDHVIDLHLARLADQLRASHG